MVDNVMSIIFDMFVPKRKYTGDANTVINGTIHTKSPSGSENKVGPSR